MIQNSPIVRERNYSLDVIKIVSCALVVLMHTLRNFDPNVESHPILYYVTRCSMPLFFMAAGAVQLTKKEITYPYCFKKILNIIILMLSYYIADFAVHFAIAFDFSLTGIKEAIRNSVLSDFAVFWFLRTMIMIYLILPVLHKIYKSKPLLILLILGLASLALNGFNIINIRIFGAPTFIEAPINPQYRLWIWLFYYFFGGVIYQNYAKIKISKPLLLGGGNNNHSSRTLLYV